MSTELPRPQPSFAIPAIVSSAMFMEMLDSTIILTALPRMAQSFGCEPVALSIGITGYLLALAVVLPASGWMADRFGTRNVFAAAIGVFTLASMLCGLSHSLGQFALARAIQGAGAAMMSPVGRVALLRSIGRERLARAMNIAITAALLGPTIGPPLGGLIATYASWRWIFFINLPVGLAGVALVLRLFPNLRASALPRFDGLSFLLNAGALIGVLYGLQEFGQDHAHWGQAALLVLAGVVLGIFAVKHALRTRQPLLNFSALKIHSFAATSVSASLIRLAVFIPQFALPLLLQLGLGMSPFISGLFILLHAGADVAMKAFVIRTLRQLGFRRLLLVSAVLFALCLFAFAGVGSNTSRLLIAALLVLSGITRSYQMTGVLTLQFADVPAALTSAASTLAAVLQQIALALAVVLAALALQMAQWWRGDAGQMMQPADFHFAFVLAALFTLAALRWHLVLPHDVGSEVSGHAAKR